MKGKIIASLMAIVTIGMVMIFSGCVEEPIPPESDISSPIQTSMESKITPSPTPTLSQTPSEPLITKAPSEIALSINDMPEGWMRYEKPFNVTSKTYERFFVTFSRELFGIDYLDCEVTKYCNVSDAKMAFESNRESYAEKIKTKSVGLGDESYGWNYGHESCVCFRKANIIADLYFESQYGKPDIEHAKKFADIVEKKIV